MEQELSRILIVEDDETILFALRSALGRNGYEVSAAGSLEEAKRLSLIHIWDGTDGGGAGKPDHGHMLHQPFHPGCNQAGGFFD